ncbi:MAG: motility protein A, partial [Clostridiales bacterium]|nr:motility protein A [Clostridiales bacterium]
MELSTILGFVAGAVFLFLGMLIGAEYDMAQMVAFWDPPSVMITGGGTIAGMLIAYTLPQCLTGLKGMTKAFGAPNNDPSRAITDIIGLANLARREGILALEERASSMEDQ